MATLGLSKVFILDKYFTELQKFWETEKKLQDASSSNEAVHLQQRLKSLSTELVTLRNRLHVGQATPLNAQNLANNNANAPASQAPGSVTTTTTSTLNQQQNSCQSNGFVNNKLYGSSTAPSTNFQPAPSIVQCPTNNPLTTSNINLSTAVLSAQNNNQSTANSNKNYVPLVSPRNTSIPLPLPHNIGTMPAAPFPASGLISTNIAPEFADPQLNPPTNHVINPVGNINNPAPQMSPPIANQQANTLNHFSQGTTTVPNGKMGHQNNFKQSHQSNGVAQQPLQNVVIQLPVIQSRSTTINGLKQHPSAIINTNQVKPAIPVGTNFGTNPSQQIMPHVPQSFPNQMQNSANCPNKNLPYSNQISNIVPSPDKIGKAGGKSRVLLKDIEDLIHLPGPLTEDAVMKTLQMRFNYNDYLTNVGPILLSINSYQDIGNPLTLSSTRSLLPLAPQLKKIVQETVRQQTETGYPQAIILSGTSGSGKTHCSMLLLRQLFAVAGGGAETDAFKHLSAAFTVLRSLGSAKTTTNSESSRIGQFIEVQVTDGALYRTKIHCYFLDQTRVIRPLPNEKNYHIFYQMMAGLSREERVRLNLEGYSLTNLNYLQQGDTNQNEKEDAARFQAWKTCLGILGIPFLDVVRVLSAVLLLGNVQFVDGVGLEVDVSEPELNAVSDLLGVPASALFRGLTTRTHNARGQLVKSVCDANMSNMTRDSLAKALYCRTVATIVRRANSLKRLGSTLGTLSSDSNESVHNQADLASQHASTIGGNTGSKSMAALNNAVRHATDGFIGILDMFGFEEPRPAQLEHLCINLCAETMQHFYNTHIFKSSVESCRDEGIYCDTEIEYVDNVPCIDLISSLRTGLLSMLDTECSVRGTAESYVAKIKVQHRTSTRLETKINEPCDSRMFMIRHFAGRVEYDCTDFLDTNRDVVPDDLVAVFYKNICNFGFATHLFGSELKALYSFENVPRGLSFRIAPTSHTDLLNGDEPVSTLTQDFHTRLDNLLRTLVHARPHFVRCIRSNPTETPGHFDRTTIVKQIRALQVLETVNLMASGFPHRMRFKQFNGRYRMLAPFRLLKRTEDKVLEDCKMILQYALKNPPDLMGSVTLSWAPGKRHIFLSEGIRQQLEKLRSELVSKSANLIQTFWKDWQLRKRMGPLNRPLNGHNVIPLLPTTTTSNNKTMSLFQSNANPVTRMSNNQATTMSANNAGTIITRPRRRPQPIAGTPPPEEPNEEKKCDSKIIQQIFGLDLERPPPVPPSRPYTVTGNSKLGYPQTRIMKMTFPEDVGANNQCETSSGEQLKKGEAVSVVGASHRRGHLIVEHSGVSFHVPFQFMELVKN